MKKNSLLEDDIYEETRNATRPPMTYTAFKNLLSIIKTTPESTQKQSNINTEKYIDTDKSDGITINNKGDISFHGKKGLKLMKQLKEENLPITNIFKERENKNMGGLLEDEREKYGVGGAAKALAKLTSKLISKHQKQMAKQPIDAIDNTRYFDYNDAARMLEDGEITIPQANQLLKSAGYPEKDVQEFTKAYGSLSLKPKQVTKESDLEKEMRPMTEAEKESAFEDLMDQFNQGGRVYAAEGGDIDGQMAMLMMPKEPEDEMLPDNEMEDEYLDFILDEALDNEEEDYLMQMLQSNERLSEIFDKVIEVASEFAGSGPVEGPGSGVSDSIPARLSDGEFVFTAKAVEEIGADNLMAMMKDAEMKADERQGLAEGGQPEEEEIVVMPVEEPASQQDIRVTKTTVGSEASQQEVNDLVDEEVKKSMLRGSRNLG